MKKLKKLTRKGLDELAKEMPEMKAVEQSECVGAYRIYLDTGDGSKSQSWQFGDSQEIKVMTASDMTNLAGENYGEYETLERYVNGKSLPLSTNNMNMKILYSQVLGVVEYHGLGSGVVITQGTLGFGVTVDTSFVDHTTYVGLPSDSNGHMYQNEIDYTLDGLNDYYDSGLILRQQGLI